MCSTVKKDPNIMNIIVASNNFGTSSSDFLMTFCKYNLKIVSWFFGNSYNRGVYILSLDTIREKSSHWGWWVFTNICGKVVFSVLKEDDIQCICILQVCTEQEASIEKAIHSMSRMYKDEKTLMWFYRLMLVTHSVH